jgi:hypothetical protein
VTEIRIRICHDEIGKGVIAHERPDAGFLFFPSQSAAIHLHEALLLPPLQQTSFPLEIRGMCLLLQFYGFFD